MTNSNSPGHRSISSYSLDSFHQGIEETMPPFLGFAVSFVVGTPLVRRVHHAHIVDVVGNTLRTRLLSEQTITLLPFDLDNLRVVVVGSEPKRLSVSPDEETLSACPGFTNELGYKFFLLKVRLVLRHDGLLNPTWKNRSNGIDPVPIELVQKSMIAKRIYFELIGVALVTATTRKF